MPVKRRDSSLPARAARGSAIGSETPASIAPVPISPERRALIEAEVEQLSATARKVAVGLPLSADVSDFMRILEEAGTA